jgi:hypothetical protein
MGNLVSYFEIEVAVAFLEHCDTEDEDTAQTTVSSEYWWANKKRSLIRQSVWGYNIKKGSEKQAVRMKGGRNSPEIPSIGDF